MLQLLSYKKVYISFNKTHFSSCGFAQLKKKRFYRSWLVFLAKGPLNIELKKNILT